MNSVLFWQVFDCLTAKNQSMLSGCMHVRCLVWLAGCRDRPMKSFWFLHKKWMQRHTRMCMDFIVVWIDLKFSSVIWAFVVLIVNRLKYALHLFRIALFSSLLYVAIGLLFCFRIRTIQFYMHTNFMTLSCTARARVAIQIVNITNVRKRMSGNGTYANSRTNYIQNRSLRKSILVSILYHSYMHHFEPLLWYILFLLLCRLYMVYDGERASLVWGEGGI